MVCRRVLVATLLMGTLGCTHTQLRLNTVRQASTVADIYQQQVLDNLAKFARDPNALPHFALSTGGFNEVNDAAEAGGGLEWNFTRFSGAGLNGGGSRALSQNWTLRPISDPRRLELMRCAFQHAVSGYQESSSGCCPDCQKRINKFYTGNTGQAPPAPCDAAADGTVTAACLGSGWFCVGCEKCALRMKKRNPCCLVGTYCGCAVWVQPGQGTDELSKLTLVVLDYAINDPPPVATKEVKVYLTADRRPATSDTATFTITGNLRADSDVRALLSTNDLASFDEGTISNHRLERLQRIQQLNELQNDQPLQQWLKSNPEGSSTDEGPGATTEQFQQKFKALSNELLKDQLAPDVSAPTGAVEAIPTPASQPPQLQTPGDQLFQLQQRIVN